MSETKEKEDQQLEADIRQLELSRINLRVSPVIFDRLNKQAEFKGLTIEEHCTAILTQSIDISVGKPVISAPGKVNGQELTKRVTKPSFASKYHR